MRPIRIVLDTSVLVSAIRSNRGASFQILSAIDSGRFEISLSVPLVIEYEYAILKAGSEVGIGKRATVDIVDYLCKIGRHVEVFYLWRPMLKDPSDDMVLEVAVADSCDGIVTHNVGDFRNIDMFGLHLWTPGEFLHQIMDAQ